MSEVLDESAFMRACRGEASEFTPVWLNRQAGRYMPEYHALKGDTRSLDFFKNPELAARATVDAQRILGVDAAIMFADLLPILEPMGLKLDYVTGVGPMFDNPVREAHDVDALRVVPATEGTPYVVDTIKLIRNELPANIPLIGFAGAPFTLASYAVEGRGSRNYLFVKRLMYADEGAWSALMDKLVETITDYVRLQIRSGVQAVQLFDSWIGCLSRDDFRRYAFPFTKRLIEAIGDEVPIIYFGTGNGHLVDDMYACGPQIMALDWRTPLRETWDRLGCRAVQGNLDPIALCADRDTVARKAQAVLDEAGARRGHIFNLGHGIIPDTPVDHVKYLVEYVHEKTARARA